MTTLKLASDKQRTFVAKIIGCDPVADLTSSEAGHIIAAYYAPSTGRTPHPHEVAAIQRARR